MQELAKDPIKTALSVVERSGKTIIASVDEEGLSVFYFTTNTSSMRVRQYLNNPKASIYFYDARFFRGVMLKGTMAVLQDAASKERIWQDGDTMYYPLGVTDPDYCVLRFTAKSGRLYENFGSVDFLV